MIVKNVRLNVERPVQLPHFSPVNYSIIKPLIEQPTLTFWQTQMLASYALAPIFTRIKRNPHLITLYTRLKEEVVWRKLGPHTPRILKFFNRYAQHADTGALALWRLLQTHKQRSHTYTVVTPCAAQYLTPVFNKLGSCLSPACLLDSRLVMCCVFARPNFKRVEAFALSVIDGNDLVVFEIEMSKAVVLRHNKKQLAQLLHAVIFTIHTFASQNQLHLCFSDKTGGFSNREVVVELLSHYFLPPYRPMITPVYLPSHFTTYVLRYKGRYINQF